ncbi:DNA-3-methyladenine glycosylase I [Vibrio viridaestus]|uniref:DNA-3-methyladenine glycosylase I n=1 Tax=Vibrio viridaestus TaxID=2487322 RepID=A0A3N9TGY4_9VIBR|nr:DNA-3-methyladenine glycosylase I [Vibrio viridaestus]RQW62735.1 DNA-3-methyladenine glycosylase I [Vibrio viridaestus]
MTQERFSTIQQRALERKGGKDNLNKLLSSPLSKDQIADITEDRWLAGFSLKVFQSGIRWDVVRKKWPAFEEVFFKFNPDSLLLLSDEQWESKAQDPRIIRHLTKVMSIPHNAQMIVEARREHGSFSEMIANWPSDSISELWLYLKKHGKRLGGNTGPYSLRQMGVDTFLLTSDIEAYLRNTDIINTSSVSKKTLISINQAFTEWQQQSGLPFTQISQIIAYSVGDNTRFAQ